MQIKINQNDHRNIDLEQIQDQVFRAAVQHRKECLEGKAKREALRLRKEQNRLNASVCAV